MIITEEIFEQAASRNGGWSGKQTRLLGYDYPLTKGWKSELIGKEFPDEVVEKFIALKDRHLKGKGDKTTPEKIGRRNEITDLRKRIEILESQLDYALEKDFS